MTCHLGHWSKDVARSLLTWLSHPVKNGGLNEKEACTHISTEASEAWHTNVLLEGANGIARRSRNVICRDVPKGSPWSNGAGSTSCPSINDACDLEDLIFDGFLGSGAHGSVHRAFLNDDTVAVKIVQQKKKCPRQGCITGHLPTVPEMELLKGVAHPFLVEIYEVREVIGEWSRDLYASGNMLLSSFETEYFAGPYQLREAGRSQAEEDIDLRVCIVMEYCDRGSLWDAVRTGNLNTHKDGVPQYDTITEVALEIALAMDHLHKQGIIHGDLKAQNVMLSSSRMAHKGFVAKVGDFGFCRKPCSRAGLTTFTWGTVDHMPPETLKDGRIHFATDVYSFGILFLEMISARHPYQGMSTPAVIVAIVQGLRPHIPDSCPTKLAKIISMCWKQDWRQRPTFEGLVQELGTILNCET